MSDWDMAVIGGGGAGLSAAVSAAELGARVVLFESEGELGGSTQLSAGVFNAANTSVQRALGINDSVEAFFHHYMTLNQWRQHPGRIYAFCSNATPTFEWLLDLGVEVPARHSGGARIPGLYQAGVEEVPRGHVPVDGGYGIVEVLDRARRSLGVEVVLNTRVERLLVEDGDVVGLVADDVELPTAGVVVATGGFAQNPDLVAKYYPEALDAGDSLFVVAAPGSRGDHIAFAEQAGADLVGQGQGLLLISAYFQRYHHDRAGVPPLSRLYVDGRGRRFVDEDASYAVASQIFRDHGGFAWAIFDEKARLSLDSAWADWTPERIQEEADAGRTHRAGSLEGLAAAIGADPDVLAGTVVRWNENMPHGNDPDFLRHVNLEAHDVDPHLDPVDTPPFYAVKMLPGELVTTHTGLRIDTKARVLDDRDRPVPGLYAAGEAGGGILGERYVGGGASIANSLTMGRIAAHSAVKRLKSEGS